MKYVRPQLGPETHCFKNAWENNPTFVGELSSEA